MTYENILVDIRGSVALLTLNRPKMLNALSAGLIKDLGAALHTLEDRADIRVFVLTGSEKAFAAGADIKEMAAQAYIDVFLGDLFADLTRIMTTRRKPIIAAVAGYALGGGCELAMMCDMVIAADTAKFGQPEITLGTIPGIGGTQRLTRAVGKAKAMDMILTARQMDAREAEQAGLVSRVVPADKLLSEALQAAEKIAAFSLPAVMMAKECVDRSHETTLNEGIQFERRLFHGTFAIEDRVEGMAAFSEKRTAQFHHR